MTTAIEQRYAMTRVEAGDYLIPSNDGKTLWRLRSYHEDGSAYFVDRATGKETKIVGTFWSALRFNGPVEEAERLLRLEPPDPWDPPPLLDPERWIESATTLKTRREALEYALTVRPT